jgi:4-hydroxy-tetrahydrodipicolinate synthase
MVERMSGVLCPVITPFNEDLSPDPDRLIRQCQWLLSQNVGLAVFGTNSEANSLSLEEKMLLLDRLVDAGIDTNRMMPGTGCCALTETVALTKHAVKLGCAGTLMLPPFYYKDVSDDGLFASFAEVIERIDRLVKAYPQTVVGIKDSSGDWNNTNAMLERRWDDFRVFAGAETFLLQNMRGGGAGCISATANINPAAIDHLFQKWQSAEAERLQQQLDEIRAAAMAFPMIPALKATVAHFAHDAQWRTVRPPLVALADEQCSALIEALKQKGFDMPGLA